MTSSASFAAPVTETIASTGHDRGVSYRLLERLGAGGTGIVYRAVRLDAPERPVAVKFLTEDPGHEHPARVADLDRLLRLDHPHLVRISACGRLAGRPWLEMEYVPGGALRERMRGVARPAAAAIEAILGLASALEYLHSRDLLHLDLKPENVLCHPCRGVQLADLDGVVSLLAPRLIWTRGSTDYSAPEQRFGLPVDARADLFALAAVGYELFTGRLPGRVFVPTAFHQPGLPARLDEVLRAGLARDRDDRPRTVSEFGHRLKSIRFE